MAMKGPMVVTTPQGLEIRARRRLGEAGAFEALVEELANKLQHKEGEAPGTTVADCDLSQNSLSFDQFEAIFTQLGAHGARVQRFRLFGCPTLNDEVLRVISDYLRLLNQETAPHEMHLSDCAISTEGFTTFMGAIEDTELYPLMNPQSGKPTPLYLRIENNYISEATIQEKVDAGVVRPFNKNSGSRPGGEGGVKVNLVVRQVGQYQQKQGEPPAPEDAPPPKEVWDKFTQNNSNWTPRPQVQPWGQNSWVPAARPGGAWAPTALAAGVCGGYNGGAAAAFTQRQAFVRPVMPIRPGGVAAAGSTAQIRPIVRNPGPVANAAQAGRATFSAFAAAGGAGGGKGGGKAAGNGAWPRSTAGGTAASYGDRSRTPVQRGVGGKPMQPNAPPPATNTDLPHPWEEHWSEEYGIPYFWNAESGEALWEKPTV